MAQIPVTNDTPIEIPPIETGTYDLEIEGEPTIEENSKKDGLNLVVKFRVQTGEFEGRKITDWCSLKDPAVRAKRLCVASGITQYPPETSDLMGKVVKAKIVKAQQRDRQSGQMVLRSNIVDYIIE